MLAGAFTTGVSGGVCAEGEAGVFVVGVDVAEIGATGVSEVEFIEILVG